MRLEAKLSKDAEADYCPARATLALLGQKWVLRIIYELRAGKRRFNELGYTVGGCNSRTLRDRLKHLEELSIVSRHAVSFMPPWVEYELTPAGHELAEALTGLEAWGRQYLAVPPAPVKETSAAS